MASPIGAVYVELGADTAQFKAGMKDAQRTAQEFGREVTAVSRMATHNARNLAFQLVDIGQSIPLAFQSPLYALQNLGFQMAQIGQIYAGQGGMRQALTDTVGLLGGVARSAGPAIVVVGAIGAALAGMTAEINAASDVTVSFGDVALASFQVIRDGIMGTLMPAVEAIAPGFKSVWDAVVSGTVTAGNALINAMRIAAEGIATAVLAIPPAFDAAFEKARSVVLFALADMAGAVDRFIHSTITGINEAFGTSLSVPSGIAEVYGSLNRMGSDALEKSGAAAESMTAAWEAFRAKAADIAASDPLGTYFEAVSAQAQAIARARDVAGGGGGGGGGRAGGSAAQAAKEATLQFRALKVATSDVSKEMSIARDVTGGFLSTFNQGLRNGESAWHAFANAAISALDRITDKILNDVLDAIFQVNNAGGGGGGWLGKLLGIGVGAISGGIGGLQFSSNFGAVPTFGGTTSVRFAKGGVINGPTVFPMARGMGLMGEAGPEAVMPLRRGPNGKLGVEAAGGGVTINQYNTYEGVNHATRAMLEGMLSQSEARILRAVPDTAAAGFRQRPGLRR